MVHNRMLKMLWKSIEEYYKDSCQILSAALAFYTMFSLAPILFIATAGAGMLFTQESAEKYMIQKIGEMIGAKSAAALNYAVKNIYSTTTNIILIILSLIFLIYIASTVFANLKTALNKLWKIEVKERHPVMILLRNRLWAFLMLLIVGLLIIISMVFSLVIAALSTIATNIAHLYLFQVMDIILWFSLTTVLFGLVYVILPSRKIRLVDGIPGALLGAALFTIGKFLISLYIGNSRIATVYGTAGSFIVILIWLYYSSQIFFIGAEFTKIYVKAKEGPGEKLLRRKPRHA